MSFENTYLILLLKVEFMSFRLQNQIFNGKLALSISSLPR